MSILQDLLSEKKAERRRLMSAAEVLAKQINGIEAEIKKTAKPAVKAVVKKSPTKPARKGAKK